MSAKSRFSVQAVRNGMPILLVHRDCVLEVGLGRTPVADGRRAPAELSRHRPREPERGPHDDIPVAIRRQRVIEERRALSVTEKGACVRQEPHRHEPRDVARQLREPGVGEGVEERARLRFFAQLAVEVCERSLPARDPFTPLVDEVPNDRLELAHAALLAPDVEDLDAVVVDRLADPGALRDHHRLGREPL